MRELQAQIIREMGVKPNMTEEQAREEVERRIQFICDYLEATAKDGVSYAQVLASLVPVYFTKVTSSYTLTTTAQITSGSVAMQLTEGGEYTFKDLAGLRASATITR